MELMYPKKTKRKQKKSHSKSIIPQPEDTCYLCVALHSDYRRHMILHRHHIFGGPNRQLSEKYGLTVLLCPAHHEYGPEAVHGSNMNTRSVKILHEAGRQAFEKTHPELSFRELFGKNYL